MKTQALYFLEKPPVCPLKFCVPGEEYCEIIENEPVCLPCDPVTGCKVECIFNQDCNIDEHCTNGECVAVCDETRCGTNATCTALYHSGICNCFPEFTGDPYEECCKF